MRHLVLLFLVALLGISSTSLAGVISPARIMLVDGDVLFRTPDDTEWLTATVNTPLDEGDALWTPNDSRTEIQLADGTVVRIDGGTQLDLIAVEDGFTHLHLARGNLYLRTSAHAGSNSLQIDADDTTVLPDARTRLRIDMLPDNQEDVAIFKGSAYVEGNGSRTKVRAGEHIALEEGHNELLQLNPPDSWERWNRDRDRIQSLATSSDSNLPDELRPYTGELNASGQWVRVPDYGMVWRPTVILSDDWAPYRSGRWVWKGDDYVWISYENWGWAPYHYGRWAVFSGFGWCWVPPARGDIYWGPGYVGWYRSGNHVGWTPLAPGETFYGRRNYGRHSATSVNSPVNSLAIQYRNRNVRGGFSVLLENDFLRGRAAFQKPAGAMSVSLGSPRIQPTRESRMPIIRQTPPRVAPPEIWNRDRRELRERFPRVIPENDRNRRPQQPAVTTTPVPTQPGVTPEVDRHQRPQPSFVSPSPAPAPPRTTQEVIPYRHPRQPTAATPAPAPFPAIRPQEQPSSRQQSTGRIRSATDKGNVSSPEHTEHELPANPVPAEKQLAPQGSLRQGDQAIGQGARATRQPREVKQRRVWRVTTTEPYNTNEPKDKDSREQRRSR
ncbi:MAG: FecR family protein [Desulfuromonadaceae bacterium]|nr:FecR family protein [Desulfuromonadaceae bacterium]